MLHFPTVILRTIKHKPGVCAQWADININWAFIIGVQHFTGSMVVEEWASILLCLWVTFGHDRHDNIKMMLTHPANAIESETVYISLVFMQKLNNFHHPITSQACTCGHIELGDAGILLDDAEQASVRDAGAADEVQRPQRPLRPRGQLGEDFVGDPVAERRLHRDATPQEGVPRDGLAEEAAHAPAGQQLGQPHVAQGKEQGGVRLAGRRGR